MFSSRKRSAKTEQLCPKCNNLLDITRDCHSVNMYCPHCKKFFPLKDFISSMDQPMSEFLEEVYMDRI